ncbi:MAG: flagellar biosynthetic protein FliR [Myxococcota bacterium]
MSAFPSAELLVGYIFGVMLIMVRVLGAVWWVPGLGENQAPMRLRVTFALVVAVVLDLGLGGLFIPPPTSLLHLALLVGREVLLGLSMGFALSVILTAVEAAGSVAALSMGLSFNVFVDPTSGNESLAIGALLRMGAALIFVVVGGPNVMLLTVFQHLQHVPPGELVLAMPTAATLGTVLGNLAMTALSLSAPVVIATLVLNIAMAFVTRVVPAANLFAIGVGAMLIAGLLSMGMMGDALVFHMDHAVLALPRQMLDMAGAR